MKQAVTPQYIVATTSKNKVLTHTLRGGRAARFGRSAEPLCWLCFSPIGYAPPESCDRAQTRI